MLVRYKGPHGPTMWTREPLLEAMRYQGYLRRLHGWPSQMTHNLDGSVTVQGQGMAPLTFDASVRGVDEDCNITRNVADEFEPFEVEV